MIVLPPVGPDATAWLLVRVTCQTGPPEPRILSSTIPNWSELTSERYTTGIRSGYLVRTPPRRGPWVDMMVWWPTRDGGAFIDLGTGFFGLLFRMYRSGIGYSGTVATYQDVGYDSKKSTADLWPITCEKMPPRQASNPNDHNRAEGAAVARYFLNDLPGGAWKGGGYEWLTAGRMYSVRGSFPETFPPRRRP